ncbi:MAG: terminase gpA endonuclease subunit [Roseobacter sp.]
MARRRRKALCLDAVPPEVLVLTAGADIQQDRIEVSCTGWTKDDDMRVLARDVIWGSPTENETWAELDDALKRYFRHPHGGVLNVGAAIIESGDWADQVYAFCRPRAARRMLAGKGMPRFGRPSLAFSESRNAR